MRLEKKVAIVTGSTRGIGRATALRFAAEGAKVIVTGLTEDAGRKVEDTIRSAGGDALYVRTDLAHEEDVVRAVEACVARYGPPTVLVNNAAPTDLVAPGRSDARVTELSNEGWDSIMLVGLKAVVWGCMYALTRSMAVEYAPDHIRVNCIVSGMVLSSPGAFKMMEDPVIGGATKAMHLTRLGLPEDIANA